MSSWPLWVSSKYSYDLMGMLLHDEQNLISSAGLLKEQ